MGPSSLRFILACLGASTALCLSATAEAQSPVVIDRAATDGVDRPIHDISSEGDASSLEVNPALLAAARGLDIVMRGYVSNDTFGRGDGVGGFFSLGGMGFAAAFGVQALRPGFDNGQFDAEAIFHPDALKLSGGFALGSAEHTAIGFGFSRLRSETVDGPGWIRGTDLDIGLVSRISNYASIGLTTRLSPVGLTGELTRSFLTLDSELALRPLGTRWLEVAAGVRARADQADGKGFSSLGNENLMPHARVALRYQGLSVSGELEQVPVNQLDENTLEVEQVGTFMRGSLNLGLDWDYMGIEIGSHVGPNKGITGTGFALHMGTERRGRAFWMRPIDVERIEMSGVKGERQFLHLLRRVGRAADAGKRSVLLVDCRGLKLGWASLQELRAEFIRARNAGTHVFAYIEGAGLQEYYLASVAEQVYVHTMGELSIHGLSSTGVYFNNLLENLGVHVEALHIKEYKSMHERFSREDRSAYDREQREAMMQTIYDTVVHDIAQARGLSLAQVQAAIDEAPHGPDAAIEMGLADEIVHRDEVLTNIGQSIGMPVEYKPMPNHTRERETWSRAPYFAIIPVEGTIVDGESQDVPFLGLNFAGGDTIAQTLRTVREDPSCVGIVLRVNSGGGSALASEVMWREVQRTREAHERDDRNPPIVISMSDVAASGGYYIAMGAETVFVQPMTITGSIGVVSIHFDIQNLLEVLGIGVDTITKGKYADIGSVYRHFDKEEKKRLEASMLRIYDVFTQRVADNRGMSQEKINELGRGHVYSGADAKKLGLVDEFGGLREAVEYLREKAHVRKLPRAELRVFPRYTGLLALLLNELGDAGEKIAVRRDAAKAKKHGLMPRFVSAAVARLPLSLLFLPQGKAQMIVDRDFDIH